MTNPLSPENESILKTRLRQVVPNKETYQAAWKEFTRRNTKSPVPPQNILYDLIWEYQMGKWPKKKA